MPPVGMTTYRHLAPSAQQVALAFAILAHKPQDIAAREYVFNLRVHFQTDQSPISGPDSSHYVDLLAYWKAQYQNMLRECNRLRSVNIYLERSVHQLGNSPTLELDTGSAPQNSKKRERPTFVAQATKRPRSSLSDSIQGISTDAQSPVESTSDPLHALECERAALTQALFNTHILCKASPIDLERLCANLAQTSNTLGKVILAVAKHQEDAEKQKPQSSTESMLQQDKPDLAAALSVCVKAFLSVLVGLKKLPASQSADHMKSLVIFELVGMFNTVMQSFENAAWDTAKVTSLQDADTNGANVRSSENHHIKESVSVHSVALLLIEFLGHLDKTNEDHQKLFEGFTVVLLERVAKWLYYYTFGHHRSNMAESNFFSIIQDDSCQENSKRKICARMGYSQVKALVMVLDRAMSLAPDYAQPQRSRVSMNPTQLGPNFIINSIHVSSQAGLSLLAKQRVQRTLITCMYGGNLEDKVLDVLTKPILGTSKDSVPKVAKVGEEDVKTWYKQEVWRLLGWDVLANEDSW